MLSSFVQYQPFQLQLSKKDSSSGELETLRRSRNPTTVVTANGEVQTNEEARVYVHDLNLFVTVQLLEDTLALSPGKLCEEHGYTCEWASGQKPHPTKDGKNFSVQDAQFRACCCPGTVVKLQRKLVFYIVGAGFIKFVESSKFTK